MYIRQVENTDLPLIFDMNEAAVPSVNSISIEKIHWFLRKAIYFRVGKSKKELAGFLIALTPGINYNSPNYSRFDELYSDFIYIDRIVIGSRFRRRRIATTLYNDLFKFAGGKFKRITCEVNLYPKNEASIYFHKKLKFKKLGTQKTEGGTKTVVLMIKDLTNPES